MVNGTFVEPFHKCVTNIGSCVNYKLPKRGQDPNTAYKTQDRNFFCAPTDPTEIINIVKSANSSKSSGVDNIDPCCAKHYSPDDKPNGAHLQ